MICMGDVLRQMALYLDDYFTLGRYLEPSIDVDPIMIAMTSKVNDQAVH